MAAARPAASSARSGDAAGLAPLTDLGDREIHRRDETAYLPAGLPLAVALPADGRPGRRARPAVPPTDVPIVPRGAGTGLSGGAAGIEGALTIAFTRMNRVLEIDRENLAVTTQPGVVNADLKAAVAAEGLFYAPDPASYETCTIGGNLGTNAGGLCCVKYGVTRDAVLGLEVVMADATVLRLGGKNVKDVAGYGLIPLIVGSQGTLGLITEATLRLRSAPPPRSTLLAFFPTLEAAGEAVAAMTRRRARAGDARADGPVHDPRGRRRPPPGPRPRRRRDAARGVGPARGGRGRPRSTRPRRRVPRRGRRWWSARRIREADWLRQGRRLAYRALEHLGVARMEDVGVPRSRVPEMLRAIEAISVRHRIAVGTFGHAGDGNLHPTFILDRGEDDTASVARLEAARTELYEAALALGGTVTGEHGIGAARRDWLVRQRGEGAVAVYACGSSAAWTRGTLLNPGRVLLLSPTPLGMPRFRSSLGGHPGARATRRRTDPALARPLIRSRTIPTSHREFESMGAIRVLVAFACQNGSTAGIAEAIVTELRRAGFAADCRPAASITDLSPYGAVILGSGVFLARRPSDGGGFTATPTPSWRDGPSGSTRQGPSAAADAAGTGDVPVVDAPGIDLPGADVPVTPVARVARAIGARGSAAFGTARLQVAANDGGVPQGDWQDLERVRTWALAIVAELPRAGVARVADRDLEGDGPPARSRGRDR